MFANTKAYSGFSVNNLEKAKDFYCGTLGIECTTQGNMGLMLHLATGGRIFIYSKEDHLPAGYTVLNFPVDNIDEAVDRLSEKGVEFEFYNDEDLPQDEKGICRAELSECEGPDIAWFTDPAGNVLSVLQETSDED